MLVLLSSMMGCSMAAGQTSGARGVWRRFGVAGAADVAYSPHWLVHISALRNLVLLYLFRANRIIYLMLELYEAPSLGAKVE
jgi:hypothetical protein